MPVVTPVADLLKGAAHQLETRGHGTGEFVDDVGQVCLLSALVLADHPRPDAVCNEDDVKRLLGRETVAGWRLSGTFDHATDLLSAHVALVDRRYWSLYEWSDHTATGKLINAIYTLAASST